MPLQICICNKLLHITKLFLCHIELVMTTFERMSNLVTTTTCELISCTFWLSFLRDSEDKKKVGECSRPLQANITTIRCLPSTKENALGLHSWRGVFYFEAVFGQMVLSAWFVARFCTAPQSVLQLPCSRFYSACVAAIPQKAPRSRANTISTRATLPPIRYECIIAVSFSFLLAFLFLLLLHIPVSSSREGNIFTLEPLAKCCWLSISFLLAWNQNNRL